MGQANKKKRDCPAVRRVITPAECGANRAGAYACPSDCPHNPWGDGHYDEAHAIEDEVGIKMVHRLYAENGGSPTSADMAANRSDSFVQRHYHFIRRFQLDRDKQGRNFVERWQADRFEGLKNDEINLLRWKTQSRVRLLEFRRVGPQEGMCEAVDLLDPARGVMRIMDRACYRQACRFQHLLTWTYEQPHYTRILGIGLPLPQGNELYADDFMRLIVDHLGGPSVNGEIQHWMAEHFLEVEESMDACQEALYQQMIKNTDMRYVTTVYQMRGTLKDLLQRLDSCDLIETEPQTPNERAAGFIQRRVWFMDPATESELVGSRVGYSSMGQVLGRAVLGTVLCGLEKAQLEASSIDKSKVLRKKFEKLAGNLVSMRSTHELDLGAQTLAQRKPYKKKLVPDALLPHATTVSMDTWSVAPNVATGGPADRDEIMRKMDEGFIETRVPGLKNLTPREAASDPEVRPLLVRLIKARVSNTDQQNLKEGTNYDCNWMVKELGLTEILIEPPPRRASSSPADEADDDPTGEDIGDTMPGELVGLNMSLPPSPLLPPEPFTAKDVQERHVKVLHTFRAVDEMGESFDNAAPDLIDTLNAAMPENSSEDEFAIMMFMAANVWSIFVPPGTRGWLIDDATFREELARGVKRVASIRSGQEFAMFLSQSRQPALMEYMGDLLQQSLETSRKEGAKINPSANLVLLVMMRVLIDGLDKAARPTGV